MRLLLFFAKVAFVFNLFFIACLFFRYNDIVTDQSLEGFVIVMGWLIAPIINFIFNITFVLMRLLRKGQIVLLPSWLLGFNFLLFIAQIIIFLFI
jgi:hypothetical protein